VSPSKILAVIPARSGSKSIKDKNLIKIGGKTLINLAVSKAIKSNLFSKVLISTDSIEYANEAIRCGAEILELRSKKLSDHKTTLALVLKDIIEKLHNRGEEYENIISIQPTSPFTEIKTLKKIVNIFFKKKATGVATISKIMDSHPLTAQKINKNGKLSYLVKPKNFRLLFPRQNRPTAYRYTGAVYLRKCKNILKYSGDGWALGKQPYGVVVGHKEAIDINYKEDLFKIKYFRKNG